MNDENENEEEFGVHFHALPLQQIFEGMQAQHDHTQMHAEAVKHEMMDFVRGLDKEDLMQLDRFLGLTIAAPDSGRFYQGIIAATLENKHDICAVCHVNHDEAMRDILDASQAQAEAEKEKARGARPWSEVKAEAHANMTPEERAEHDAEIRRLIAAERQFDQSVASKMEEYNVEPWGENLLPDQADQPYPPGAVRCKNCQMMYVSLEDRMLKGPEPTECDGCVQKMKTG